MKKDEKYSWLILFASFSSLTLSLGIPLSFGIFFTVLVDHFKDQNSKAEVAVVGSIAFGMLNLTGPLSSLLYREYGCRFVVILGGFIASFGLFLSYFATGLWFLCISYGVITGLGCGFIYAPALAVLPDYFDKYRYFATSFATVGSALGTLVMPQVLMYLIEAYTWRGAMVFISGLMMQTVIFGMLMKSRSKLSDRSTTKIFTFELQIFRDSRFYFLCLEAFCFAGSSYTMFTTVNSLVIDRGLSKEFGATLSSIIGISNILGRVVASLISQLAQINRPLLFAFISLSCSVSSYLSVICYQFWSFTLCFIIFGFSYGMRISQVSGILMDTFGVDKIAGAIGYYFCAGGIGALVITPIAVKNVKFGGSASNYNSISDAVITAASINLFNSILCFIVAFLIYYKRRKYGG